MNSHRKSTVLIVIASIILFSSGLPGSAALAAPARVAVLPFGVSGGGDLGYAQTEIRELLSARLGREEWVRIIEQNQVDEVVGAIKGFTGESLALIAGAKLQADYVLYGEMVSSGDRFRIDARLAEMTGKREPLDFTNESNTLDGMIPEINRFATRVNKTIAQWRGVEPAKRAMRLESEAPAASRAVAVPASRANQAGAATVQQRFATPPAGTQLFTGESTDADGSWQSAPLKHRINGIALGDVNNDGVTETVFISEHAVHIRQLRDRRFILIADLAPHPLYRNVALDVADINDNGVPEIFVTRLSSSSSRGDAVESIVLEYDGSGYATLVENAPWYFRVVSRPGAAPLLLGQEQKPNTADLFSLPVFSMSWRGGAYAPDAPLIAGGKANALGTTWLPGPGMKEGGAIAFGPDDHIRVLGERDNVLRESEDPHGGGMSYIEMPDDNPVSDATEVRYFPLRLLVSDIDGDGNAEVLTASNQEFAKRLFQRFRSLSKGRITALSLTGAGLSPTWRTSTLKGFVSDFSLGDIDSDGERELVIAVVAKRGDMVLTEARSSLVVYEQRR